MDGCKQHKLDQYFKLVQQQHPRYVSWRERRCADYHVFALALPILTSNRTVRSVTAQGKDSFSTGELSIAFAQLTVTDDFLIGKAGAGKGSVNLQQSTSKLVVSNGQIILESGSFLTNAGQISQNNSQPLIIRGLYTHNATASQLSSASLQVKTGGSVLHSKGLVSITNTLSIDGGSGTDYNLQGSGTLDVPTINIGGSGAGTLLLLGSAQITQTNTINVLSGGTFDIRKDYDFDGTLALNTGTVKVNDGVTAKTLTMSGMNGLLRGKGTVDGNLINKANVDPGIGFVGSFTLNEDYQQTVNGNPFADIVGTSLSLYDNLDVTGNVTLAGGLIAALPSSFTPVIGDSFDIIAFNGSLTGTFGTVMFPPPSSGVALALIYGPNAVTLAAKLQGDLNFDGFVGIDDLNIVLGGWNQSVTAGIWLQGDPSGDGFIGIDDLNAVLDNWNAGTPPTTSVTVPEPAGIILLCTGAMGLLMKGRLTRSRGG